MASSDSTTTGTRTSTTTTTPTGPQTYGGGAFNANQLITQLMQSMTATTQALTGTQQAIQVQQTAQETAQQNQIADLQAASDEGATAAAGQAAINYAGNILKEQAQKDLSLNPDDQNNLIRRNVAVIDQLQPQIGAVEQARLQAKAEYDQAASVDLLSNPLGYIFAQLKLPSLAAKHNALASQKDALVAETDRANTEVQTRLGLLDSTKKVITANAADQIRDVDLKKAHVDTLLANARLDAAKADNASRTASMLMQQAQLLQMKNSDVRSGIDTAVRLKDFNEMQTVRHAQLEESRLRTEELRKQRQLAADQEAAINARFKVISEGLGREMPMTFHDLKALGDPKLEKAWLDAAGNLAFGGSLGDSLAFFGQANRQVLARKNSSLVTTGDQLREAVNAEVSGVVDEFRRTNMGKDMPVQMQMPAAAQKYLDKAQASAMDPRSASDLADPVWEKQYNPYKLPIAQFSQVTASNPDYAALKNNVLAQAIATITPQTPGQYLGPKHEKLALDAVAAQVAEGKLDPTTAHMFGFLPQSSYRFSVPSGAMFGGRIGANLMDEAQAANLLMRKAASIRTGRDNGYSAEYDLYVGSTQP
jgi:hypothetical protein